MKAKFRKTDGIQEVPIFLTKEELRTRVGKLISERLLVSLTIKGQGYWTEDGITVCLVETKKEDKYLYWEIDEES